MKKILVFIAICIFIILNENTFGFSPNTNKKLNTQNPFYIYDEDHNVKFEIIENFISDPQPLGDQPDLIITSLRACWGIHRNYTCEGLYIVISARNIGKSFDNGGAVIKCYVALFDNEQTTPFGYVVLTPIFSPTVWEKECLLGLSIFLPETEIKVHPEIVRAFLDYTNIIPESNEDNNNASCEVPLAITISGYVYEKNVTDELIPIKDCDVRDGSDFPYNILTRRTFTDTNGYYLGIMFPREPTDEAFIYRIITKNCEKSKLSLPTEPLMPGDSVEIDLIFEGIAPLKPFVPIGKIFGITGQKYNFFTFTFDWDSKEIYLRFYWGDGTLSDWLGPYRSLELVKESKTWETKGRKTIYLAAMDENGNLSPLSHSHNIIIFPGLLQK